MVICVGLPIEGSFCQIDKKGKLKLVEIPCDSIWKHYSLFSFIIIEVIFNLEFQIYIHLCLRYLKGYDDCRE